MTNAEKFIQIFGMYSTELWAMPEEKFLEWLNAEALEQDRWIPVTERLPEKDGDYLVTYEKDFAEDYGLDPIGIAPFEVDCEGFGIWVERFDKMTLGSLGSDWTEIKVVAWQPLPERFIGDKDGSK